MTKTWALLACCTTVTALQTTTVRPRLASQQPVVSVPRVKTLAPKKETPVKELDMEVGPGERYAAEREFPEYAAEYWNDPRIHGFGNVGFGGVVHALVAPFFTAMLDALAYDGKNVREEAWHLIQQTRLRNLGPDGSRVETAADLGCGTGFTARGMASAFDADVVAIDTSDEMLRAARDISGLERVEFRKGNAEFTELPSQSFDLVTMSFVLHECPRRARHAILNEAFRLLAPGGTIAVLDIAPTYKPSRMMLPGEPYLHGYLDNFEEDCNHFADTHKADFAAAYRDVIIKNRLVLWHFHRFDGGFDGSSFPFRGSPYFDVRL